MPAKMVQPGDQAHIDAMNAMRAQMNSPEAVNEWMNAKRKLFDAAPAK